MNGLEVGDPVLGLARGSFGSSIVVDARSVVRIPNNLSFEEAATIPMTFLTAWYGLHVLGKMQPKDKVLIHAAAGGVGMAAVQLARLHGAEVYGTASEPKWTTLKSLGFTDDHLASSRSLDFAEKFARDASSQKSFDVVLNLLASEFVDASLNLLGSGGRFLEMGKIDLREQAWVDENYPGVSYQVYNLPEAGLDCIQEMLVSLADLFAEEKLKPLPLKTFQMNKASNALRFIAQAKHIGKVVLTLSDSRPFIREDGSVLITGGVGGVGRYVSKWLATEREVKDLVLTSRSGLQSDEARSLVKELEELGVTTRVIACDTSNMSDLSKIISTSFDDKPLRGIVHAAGILDDGMISEMTSERVDAVLLPKIDGAWNLHKLTENMDLDFFVMFSSISGIVGTPGQSNYAAANTFLDALAYHRHSMGLPATTIAWGAWEGQGMAARLSDADRSRYSRQGMDALSSDEGLAFIETDATKADPLSVAAAIDLPRLQRYLEQNGGGTVPAIFSTMFSQMDGAGSIGVQDGESLQKLLSNSEPDKHGTIVLESVRAQVAKTLEFESADIVDIDLPLQDIGIDSLTAVLLRNQLADITGLALPAKIAFNHPNVRELAKFLHSKLEVSGIESSQENDQEDIPSTASLPANNIAKSGSLEPEIQFANASTTKQNPESVLLTGATGFVGAFILSQLLESNAIVYCLVRADDVDQAKERVIGTLEEYNLWKSNYDPLLNLVVGDITQPLLGIEEQSFNQLADTVDAICHSGALVDWMLPLKEYIEPNVVSFHEVLRLASRGKGKTVHLISTAVTTLKHFGYPITQEEREYGYMTSKFMAENMAMAARARGGLVSIYRLPFVGASLSSGHFRRDRGDFLHNLIAGCIEMGSFPALDADLGGVLPVDYLASTVVQVLMNDFKRIGEDHDYIHANAPKVSELVEFVNAAGHDVDSMPFGDWKQAAMKHAMSNPKGSVARISAVVDGLDEERLCQMLDGFIAILGGAPYGSVVFGSENYPCPKMDIETIQPYLRKIISVEINEEELVEVA